MNAGADTKLLACGVWVVANLLLPTRWPREEAGRCAAHGTYEQHRVPQFPSTSPSSGASGQTALPPAETRGTRLPRQQQ